MGGGQSKARQTQTIPTPSKLLEVLQELWANRRSENVFIKPDGRAIRSVRTAFTRPANVLSCRVLRLTLYAAPMLQGWRGGRERYHPPSFVVVEGTKDDVSICSPVSRTSGTSYRENWFEFPQAIHNTKSPPLATSCAGVTELADALDSRSRDGHPAWGFKSPLRHNDWILESFPRRALRGSGIPSLKPECAAPSCSRLIAS